MNYSTQTLDESAVLQIEGELDATTVPDIRPAIDSLIDQKPKWVTVDLSALRLIDSSGVGAIVSLFKRLRETGGVVRVTGLRGQPKAIFQVLRLDQVLSVR
jgi:anti-sigma B factor antagonist